MSNTITFDEQHPLCHFHYCPICGGAHFAEHGPTSRRCEDCGFTYYTNPRGATVAFIINEYGELLCGRRVNNPAKGMLDAPGGFMDLDETAEEGMCREILEETGLAVEPSQVRYLFSLPNRYEYSGIMCRTIDLFFEVRVPGRPSFDGRDDISTLQWVPLAEVRPEEFGMKSIAKGLGMYITTLNTQL